MKTKKIVSLLLTVLMACSVFAGLSVSAEDTTHTYTAVGDAAFLGEAWKPANAVNDLIPQSDGTYKITYTGVAKSDLYTVKVAEDHAWTNSFGAALGDDGNIEFSVPEDGATVDIILTVQGTKEKEVDGVLTTLNDGFVQVLVNGAAAPGKVVPEVTEHYIAGEPGLCNGVTWGQAAPENKMTANEDGSYEITIKGVQPKEGELPYEFKVTTNGAWEPAYGYDGLIGPGGANVQIMITEADSTVKIVLTKDLFVQAFVNGVKVSPDPVPTEPEPTATTNDKGETSLITYGGGFFYPPQGVECNRYFFQMPRDVVDKDGKVQNWYTFNNATATCYWWDGEYACESWQKSYQMKASGLDDIYYIDVPSNVGTIIFSNGIDGGPAPAEGEEAGPNWGKNCQTVNIGAEYYEPTENPNYPEGTESFNNMIYIVDVNNVTLNELSLAPTCGGEWRYLHADGSIDYTKGTIFEPKGISVTTDKTAVTLKNGASTTVKATVNGGDLGYTTEWASSNEKVAVVDQNGKITAKGKGKADVTVKVQNPGSETDVFVATVKVTVTQPVTSVRASSVTVYNGKTAKIKVTVSPSNASNKAVTYSSSNKSVATVTSAGVVKGVKPGTAYITVKAKDGSGKYTKCKVTVKQQKATKVNLSKTKATIAKKGKTVKIKATLAPSNVYNKAITVKSDKTKIVKVKTAKIKSGQSATLAGVKKGTAKVKFTAADGSKKSATCKVTVKK
ncbi:MAG: Ig-like domain-containing protein [Oscillospiraceae bacterium]|nr:Ig-like domain-containing protein [Oscillospiraceae bacterium]